MTKPDGIYSKSVTQTRKEVDADTAASDKHFTELCRTDLASVASLPTDKQWASAQIHAVDQAVVRLSQLRNPTPAELERLDSLLALSQKRQMLRAIASLQRRD